MIYILIQPVKTALLNGILYAPFPLMFQKSFRDQLRYLKKPVKNGRFSILHPALKKWVKTFGLKENQPGPDSP